MDNLNIVKRRASDSEANGVLALVSNQYNRIPPPLPYLPSDYQPSPDSPRHIILSSSLNTSNQHILDSQPVQSHGKRQRSRSIGYPLAIENSASTSSTSLVSNNNFELVPYREWTVIARNNQKGQLVLYNQDNQTISVQSYLPEHFSTLDPNIPVPIKPDEEGFCCPYCHRPIIPPSTNEEPDYMDRNYFRLLASSQVNTASNSPIQSRSTTFSTDEHQTFNNQNLNENAFNQGYYEKFFVELNRLGKGFRGSVFLCEHMLDGVKLGKYAVKKVAIGNNHPWLVRMLREVHLLERLRHPNIVSYKHSWLEYNRLTPFGPKVPCLFILMECANGGNLEEYFELKKPEPPKQQQQQQKEQKGKKRKDLKRERIRKQYQAQEAFEKDQDISTPVTQFNKRLLTMTEIWSLFLDIVQGLAHLHHQNIVHRDLKPPNLLLQYDVRNRNAHQGIPRILISDFGECEDLDETRINDNRTGATGTLEFMAPEHVRLDPKGRNTVDYSPKADMWSLGMVLYYLCYSRLPYSVIDDVDILRSEILSFKEIKFPGSRLEIYRDNPELYSEALNNPNLTSDIPNELKLLIRMLLSIDPNKRPSCNEILTKLKSLRRDSNTHIFHDIPAEWQPMPSSASTASTSSKRSFGSSTSPVSHGEDMDVDDPIIEEDEVSDTAQHNINSILRKRQRLLGGDEEHTDDVQMMDTEDSPLLIASPDVHRHETKKWMSEYHTAQFIKTMTAVLKITSCTFSCSPYSVKPITFYPVIFFATLDFWTQSSSPSLLLLFIHIAWVMITTLVSGGLCEA